jgi:hypothetical protein
MVPFRSNLGQTTGAYATQDIREIDLPYKLLQLEHNTVHQRANNWVASVHTFFNRPAVLSIGHAFEPEYKVHIYSNG